MGKKMSLAGKRAIITGSSLCIGAGIAPPGAIETDANAKEIAAIGKKKFEGWPPLSRPGSADDGAKTAVFPASNNASDIPGTTLEIDSGYVLNLVRCAPRKG